ncbi:alpha/beta hydrolase-fold protein [Marivirga harenae]|uniref:alpha/beta hydrolase-fold protein n=1 Tax=Marivirga harenae TaxID=2010992 RepID=UPI0026DF6D0D|nr:alpha/beta hydrolase-fold protein [Marivirga harenae]WKV10588.1 alpha/beta hydrolase-fold protein [Marivirga harenae]
MRTLLPILLIFSSFVTSCKDQELQTLLEVDLTILEKLDSISAIEFEQERKDATQEFWNEMKNNNSIPYTKDSLAVFFYFEDAQEVSWNGDFNSWSQDQSFKNDGTNIEGTKLWYWSSVFPKDARLDYKITVNGSNWILDPQNEHQQWSGFGPNSELRMPEYEAESALETAAGIQRGTVESFQIFSNQLQYEIAYQVYFPADYENLKDLPIIYVTDGHEYSDEKLGNMITVLDNLIADESLQPILTVFIDPRDPNNLNTNRRQSEYPINVNYLDFVTEELIPQIDTQYKTDSQADKRAILGTSLGGINSSYFGAKASQHFKNIAIQSPAYWYRANQIYDIVKAAEHSDTKIFMTAGTFNDGLENAIKMKEIYESKALNIELMTVNEGHSWGAWAAQLDDILVYFYGKE